MIRNNGCWRCPSALTYLEHARTKRKEKQAWDRDRSRNAVPWCETIQVNWSTCRDGGMRTCKNCLCMYRLSAATADYRRLNLGMITSTCKKWTFKQKDKWNFPDLPRASRSAITRRGHNNHRANPARDLSKLQCSHHKLCVLCFSETHEDFQNLGEVPACAVVGSCVRSCRLLKRSSGTIDWLHRLACISTSFARSLVLCKRRKVGYYSSFLHPRMMQFWR